MRRFLLILIVISLYMPIVNAKSFRINIGRMLQKSSLYTPASKLKLHRINTERGQQESKYDILQNKKGEILIIINARSGEPENPRFVYDGGETALLYRTKERVVVFENIAVEARPPLKSVGTMLIVEVENEDVAREYTVPVRIIKNVKALIR